jgi:hypothetical protein
MSNFNGKDFFDWGLVILHNNTGKTNSEFLDSFILTDRYKRIDEYHNNKNEDIRFYICDEKFGNDCFVMETA